MSSVSRSQILGILVSVLVATPFAAAQEKGAGSQATDSTLKKSGASSGLDSFDPYFDALEDDYSSRPQGPSVLSSLDVKLWGRVFFVGSYDNFQGRGGVGGADWGNYVTAEGMDQSNFNGRDTRFGFSATEKFGDWTGRAVAEIDFYGTNAGNSLVPRLRLGYVELKDENGLSVRIGQDWVPIAQQNPGTVEFGILSFSGNLWWRVPQITVRKKSGDFEFLGSVMKHRVSGAQDQQERMPWVMARAAWNGKLNGKKSTIALGGGIREATVNGTDYSSWLAALEYSLPVADRFRLKGEAWTGAGVGREFLRYNLDYNATLGREIESSGGFMSMEYKATDTVRLNAGWGLDLPAGADVNAGDLDEGGGAVPFRKNKVYFVNCKMLLSKHTGVGLEFLHFETTQLSGVSLEGDRVNLACWLIF